MCKIAFKKLKRYGPHHILLNVLGPFLNTCPIWGSTRTLLKNDKEASSSNLLEKK